MESILLIGAGGPELRKLRSHLLRKGFQVTLTEPDRLESMGDGEGKGEGEGRFLLVVLEAAGVPHLQILVDQVRRAPACREIPLMALIAPAQQGQLQQAQGLEDFLPIPAAPEAVEARLRFILRRMNHLPPGDGIRIGALELKPDRYEVLLEGEPLELTYKEFELFKFLATHPGRVFSRDQLLNQVWGYNFIGGTRTVDVHVRRLRAKLGPRYAALIDTVRNVGYRFAEAL